MSPGYSAKVTLTLIVDGVSYVLSHVGPSKVLVRRELVEPVPPCNADLIITVDDRRKVHRIFLPFGTRANERSVPYF